MTDKKEVSRSSYSADWFLRGALTRIGDTFDRLTGRNWVPSSSLATSELIERMKRLLDSEAREVPGKGIVVPHNIRLKMQWDKFSTDSEGSLKTLENELLTAAADHINDSLYYTYAPLRVDVKPDYFTEGVKLYVGFEGFSDDEPEVEMNVTIAGVQLGKPEALPEPEPNIDIPAFIARYTHKGYPREKRLEFPAGRRVTIGRTANNDLILDDVSVSKIHASLVADTNGMLSVADTGSTNGTFINDERIAYGKAAQLKDGDIVKFGTVEVRFESVQPPPVERPADESEKRLGRETVAIGGFDFATRRSESQPAQKPDSELGSTAANSATEDISDAPTEPNLPASEPSAGPDPDLIDK